ncbi:CYTH domain-containing protein [Staphylococcus taiwanensis]|nr:CYTH domain-containing protein [Staphylococcus taiwanensis]
MATNNEIEFKQLLDASTYTKVKSTFFENAEPFTQTNYYIDTPDFKLRDHHSALRIRVKNDTYELTLKVPAKVGLMEYNHMVNIVPEINALIPMSILPTDIKNIMSDYDVSEHELKILGALTTERLETNYQDELLVLDKSTYFDKMDYELEFEVNAYESGLQKFNSLLQQFDLQHEVPKNKVQRFFEYKAQISE